MTNDEALDENIVFEEIDEKAVMEDVKTELRSRRNTLMARLEHLQIMQSETIREINSVNDELTIYDEYKLHG